MKWSEQREKAKREQEQATAALQGQLDGHANLRTQYAFQLAASGGMSRGLFRRGASARRVLDVADLLALEDEARRVSDRARLIEDLKRIAAETRPAPEQPGPSLIIAGS